MKIRNQIIVFLMIVPVVFGVFLTTLGTLAVGKTYHIKDLGKYIVQHRPSLEFGIISVVFPVRVEGKAIDYNDKNAYFWNTYRGKRYKKRAYGIAYSSAKELLVENGEEEKLKKYGDVLSFYKFLSQVQRFLIDINLEWMSALGWALLIFVFFTKKGKLFLFLWGWYSLWLLIGDLGFHAIWAEAAEERFMMAVNVIVRNHYSSLDSLMSHVCAFLLVSAVFLWGMAAVVFSKSSDYFTDMETKLGFRKKPAEERV